MRRVLTVKRLLAVPAVGTLLVSAAACASSGGSPSGGSSQSTSPIKVALIAPFSGPEGYLGAPALKGIDLALKQVAPGGKIAGRSVQVVKVDDQCSPTQAVQVVRQVTSGGSYAATFGPVCAGDMTATQSTLAQAHLVHMTTGFGQTQLDKGDQYVFSGAPTTKQMMKAEIPLIESHHPSSVAILAGNDGFDSEFANFAKQDLAAAGLKVSYNATFDDTSTNFSGQVAQFKNSGANLLVLTAYEAETGAIVKQFRQEGVTAPIAAEDACDPASTAVGKKFLTNVIFALNYCPTWPAASAFTSAYKSAYGAVPTDASAVSYTNGLALFEGLKASHGQGGPALRSALLGLDYKFPFGTIQYEPNGNLKAPTLAVGVLTNGTAHFTSSG